MALQARVNNSGGLLLTLATRGSNFHIELKHLIAKIMSCIILLISSRSTSITNT